MRGERRKRRAESSARSDYAARLGRAQEDPARRGQSRTCCAPGGSPGQPLKARKPSAKSRAFRADRLQTRFPCDLRAVQAFSVSRYRLCDSLARRTIRIVVDVFGSRELPTDCRESLDAVIRDVQDRSERRRIGKQQAFELVFLNIGKHPSYVWTMHVDFLHQAFFQHLDCPISLVAKAVEVDQRRHGVERPLEMEHIRHESFDADISAAGPAAPGAAEQDRSWLDLDSPQVFGENALDELLFGLAFHRYCEADHGRPPSRFFCQSSPVVYSFSQSR